MDLDKVDKGVKKADSILGTIGSIFKKHWWVILILLFSWFMYDALSSPIEDEVSEDAPYVVEEVFDINEYGDTILIDIYSDGSEVIVTE
jgi:hypothetical protein